jgi:hypothetical protein
MAGPQEMEQQIKDITVEAATEIMAAVAVVLAL